MATELLRKRKKLNERCPECGSGQIYFRKLIGNWKCMNPDCKATFDKPKRD